MNTKLEGSSRMVWAAYGDTFHGEVHRCIMRGSRELALSVAYHGDRYDVKLTKVGAAQYAGSWVCLSDRTTGNANCTLYRSENEVLLLGEWLEDGDYYHWWVRLREVAHFADEVIRESGNTSAGAVRSRAAARPGAKSREKRRVASPAPSKKRT